MNDDIKTALENGASLDDMPTAKSIPEVVLLTHDDYMKLIKEFEEDEEDIDHLSE